MQARCLLQFLHHKKRTCCICAVDDVSTPNLYRSYGRGNLSASQNLASEACVVICVTNMFLSRNWGATDIFGKKFNCVFNFFGPILTTGRRFSRKRNQEAAHVQDEALAQCCRAEQGENIRTGTGKRAVGRQQRRGRRRIHQCRCGCGCSWRQQTGSR